MPYGCQYFLTGVDRFTRWPEAWPISKITADCISRTFFINWLCVLTSLPPLPRIVTASLNHDYFPSSLPWLVETHSQTTQLPMTCGNNAQYIAHALKTALTALTTPNQWTWTLPVEGVGKLFTRRATFEKFLKPRAALIGRAKERCKSSDVLFYTENQ